MPGALGYPALCGSPAEPSPPWEPRWIPSRASAFQANESPMSQNAGVGRARRSGGAGPAPLRSHAGFPSPAASRPAPELPPGRRGRAGGGGCSAGKGRERAAGARARRPERGGARRGQPAPVSASIPLHHRPAHQHPLHNQPNHPSITTSVPSPPHPTSVKARLRFCGGRFPARHRPSQPSISRCCYPLGAGWDGQFLTVGWKRSPETHHIAP